MRGTTWTMAGAALTLGLVAGTAAAQSPDAASLAATNPQQITIELESSGAATVTGEAVLRSAGDQTELSIDLSGAPAEAELAGFITSGVCSEDGTVLAQIGALEIDATGNGQLSAELPIDLRTVASTPVSIRVGDTAEAAVACGEHEPAGTPASAAPQPSAIPQATPEPEPAPAPAPEPMPQPTRDPAPAPDAPTPAPAPDAPAPVPAPDAPGAPDAPAPVPAPDAPGAPGAPDAPEPSPAPVPNPDAAPAGV